MKRKAINQVFAILMLMAVAVAIASSAYFFFGNYFNILSSEDVLHSPTISRACQYVNFEINNVNCENSKIRIAVENTGNIIINSNSQVVVLGALSRATIPFTPPDLTVRPGETTTLIISYDTSLGDLRTVTVIPNIHTVNKGIFCPSKSYAFTGNEGCVI